MFEIFTEHMVREEVRQMLLQLKDANYAVSTLAKEDIQRYANHFSVNIVTRKLKDGKIKVELPSLTAVQPRNQRKDGDA